MLFRKKIKEFFFLIWFEITLGCLEEKNILEEILEKFF